MERIMTELVTNISDFRKNPNQQVEEAGDLPFAVITNNRPSFYVLPPALFDLFEEFMQDRELAQAMRTRISERDKFVRVDISKL
jgi:PHD/YefM family antitoxin component YafN of YafNO toxin-antitoxin module